MRVMSSIRARISRDVSRLPTFASEGPTFPAAVPGIEWQRTQWPWSRETKTSRPRCTSPTVAQPASDARTTALNNDTILEGQRANPRARRGMDGVQDRGHDAERSRLAVAAPEAARRSEHHFDLRHLGKPGQREVVEVGLDDAA